jgi:hypothetical protein
MPAGFPVKQDYSTGDVLTAANMNDLASTLNYLDPTAKGDLFPASSGTALTRLAVGTNNAFLKADSSTATGLVWDNSGWTSYTPGLTNITLGNGTVTGAYKLIGKTVFWRAQLQLGSTTVISTEATFNAPFTAAGTNPVQGSVVLIDNSTANYYLGVFLTGYIRTNVQYGVLTATVPFTWATGDLMMAGGSYEVA